MRNPTKLSRKPASRCHEKPPVPGVEAQEPPRLTRKEPVDGQLDLNRQTDNLRAILTPLQTFPSMSCNPMHWCLLPNRMCLVGAIVVVPSNLVQFTVPGTCVSARHAYSHSASVGGRRLLSQRLVQLPDGGLIPTTLNWKIKPLKYDGFFPMTNCQNDCVTG